MTVTRNRQTAGRCHGCKVVWTWSGPIRLRDAKCPVCGEALASTATALIKDKRLLNKTARCTDVGLRA